MRAKDVRVLLLNPAPSLIKYGMKWGFEQLGCYVHLMEGEDAIYTLRTDHEGMLKKIKAAIKKHDINFVFTEGFSNMPIKEVSDMCRNNKIPFHWWAIEDPVTPHIGENLAKNNLVDFIWTTTIEFIEKYKRYGIGADLLLFACNPDFQKPVLGEDKFKHDISVVGTNYSNRYAKVREFLFPLIERDFDIKIYGLWWENPDALVNIIKYKEKNVYWKPKGYDQLPYEWLPIVVNSSKIMFGLNCSDESVTQTSCRPYETLAASGESVYLAWHTKAQDAIFGDYIMQAKTAKEMVNKTEEILSWSEPKRRAFASNAREFVVKNHTYKHRASQMINVL